MGGLLFVTLIGIGLMFWMWMLIEAATKEQPESQDRLIWVLIIVLTAIFGAVIYYFVRRPTRIATLGR